MPTLLCQIAPFTVKSLCELVDSDTKKEGRLEICVEDAEMIIDKSCGEFVFQKRAQPSTPQTPQGQDYKVSESFSFIFGVFYILNFT